MRITLLIISLLVLLAIFLQDVKERKVYWFLFPLAAAALAWLNFQQLGMSLFAIHSAINLSIISMIMVIMFLYARLKMKRPFREVFGLGDLLFFITIAIALPSLSFVVLFVGAILFSGLLHLVSRQQEHTVPLAGYMALFFALCLVVNETGIFQNMYSF